MMKRCLIISDDLTGGADTGVQFSRRGLPTFLLTARDARMPDPAAFGRDAIVVVNTDSRALQASVASSAVSATLRTYSKELFPVVYKKIDSTLRGNIGFEIDAALAGTGLPLAFIAPSFPGQNRTLAGGIMMVAGRPVALTEIGFDAVSPVTESHIGRLVQSQSSHRVGLIDLADVSSGPERLRKAVFTEMSRGSRIIIFDAVRQSDLAHIAEVAFGMEPIPLLVGSAGLAAEVAGIIAPPSDGRLQISKAAAGTRDHVFIVSGSASGVTHRQLNRLEKVRGIESFEIDGKLLVESGQGRRELERDLCLKLADSLSRGHVILKTTSGRIVPTRDGRPTHKEITNALGAIASSVLDRLADKLPMNNLAMVLTGGETAMSVLDSLSISGIEIVKEIVGGIALSRVFEGKLEDLAIVTKAGGFGDEDAMEKIMVEVGA